MQTIGRSLHNLWVIFSHEFSLFFVSPVVYIVGAGWMFVGSIAFSYFFSQFNQGFSEPNMTNTVGFLSTFVLLFTAPALTMRLVSEEINSGTHELLFTAPVRDWEVVVGKWLAAWGVFTVFVLLTGLYGLFLLWRGNPDPGLLIANYLGLWLLAGAMLAVGVFASSLTKYQVVAFMVGVFLLFLLSYLNILGFIVPNQTLTDVVNQLTLRTHQDKLIQQGVIDWADVTYFVGIMSIFMFLATQILGSRRWRS